jgi:hypothetical protein
MLGKNHYHQLRSRVTSKQYFLPVPIIYICMPNTHFLIRYALDVFKVSRFPPIIEPIVAIPMFNLCTLLYYNTQAETAIYHLAIYTVVKRNHLTFSTFCGFKKLSLPHF